MPGERQWPVHLSSPATVSFHLLRDLLASTESLKSLCYFAVKREVNTE